MNINSYQKNNNSHNAFPSSGSVEKFMFVLFVVVSIPTYFFCKTEYFIYLTSIFEKFIPAISAYGRASTFPFDIRALYALYWLTSPIFFILYKLMVPESQFKKGPPNKTGRRIIYFMLVIAVYILYFGLAPDPSENQIHQSFYTKLLLYSKIGIYVMACINWTGFYIALHESIIIFTRK